MSGACFAMSLKYSGAIGDTYECVSAILVSCISFDALNKRKCALDGISIYHHFTRISFPVTAFRRINQRDP